MSKTLNLRFFSNSPFLFSNENSVGNGHVNTQISSENDLLMIKQVLEERKNTKDLMVIGFTCNVCSQRQFKGMSKLAYEKGVVIIKCNKCTNKHLIADHLGWFDSQEKQGTIEDILRRKGESIEKLEFKPE